MIAYEPCIAAIPCGGGMPTFLLVFLFVMYSFLQPSPALSVCLWLDPWPS